MIELVIALVYVIGSLAVSGFKKQAADQRQQIENENNSINYQRTIGLKYYDLVSDKEKRETIIVGTVVLAIVVFIIVVLLMGKK